MAGQAQHLVRLAELLNISAGVLRDLLAVRDSDAATDDLDDMASDLDRIATRVMRAAAPPEVPH